MNSVNLQNALTAPLPTAAGNPKLKSAANEFEASLMQEFLKPLQQDSLFAPENADGSGESDPDSDDQGSAGALMSFGSQAMAKAISERGGFGIATKILDHFRTPPQAAPPATSGKS